MWLLSRQNDHVLFFRFLGLITVSGKMGTNKSHFLRSQKLLHLFFTQELIPVLRSIGVKGPHMEVPSPCLEMQSSCCGSSEDRKEKYTF